MTVPKQDRAVAERYVLRWLGRVGRARIGHGGKLQSGDETCVASAAVVLRLVERRAIVVSGGSFVLAKGVAECVVS